MDRRLLYVGGAVVATIAVVAIGYGVGSRVLPGSRPYAAANDAAPLPGIDDRSAIPSYSGPPVASVPRDSAPADATPAVPAAPDATLPSVGSGSGQGDGAADEPADRADPAASPSPSNTAPAAVNDAAAQ